MPLVRVTTSHAPNDETARGALLAELSSAASQLFGKPERWVMTCLDADAAMSFGGTASPAAYVEVKNIGDLSPQLARRVSSTITEIVARGLGVSADRVYIEMTAAEGERWGYGGGTFG